LRGCGKSMVYASPAAGECGDREVEWLKVGME
jgi:hypothetical protein